MLVTSDASLGKLDKKALRNDKVLRAGKAGAIQ